MGDERTGNATQMMGKEEIGKGGRRGRRSQGQRRRGVFFERYDENVERRGRRGVEGVEDEEKKEKKKERKKKKKERIKAGKGSNPVPSVS